MIQPIESLDQLPLQASVARRRERSRTVIANLVGAAWPPLIITLGVWPPHNWIPGLEFDWRLSVLVVGLLACPGFLWLIDRERQIGRGPTTRVGIVWRYLFYGGLLSAALWVVLTLLLSAFGAIQSSNVGQVMGSAETNLMVFGVGALPIAVIIGLSYAFWAGLCAAFIAFEAKPEVRDRLGLMGDPKA